MTKILVNALQFSTDGAGISKYSHKLAAVIMKNNPNVDVLCRKDMLDKFENKERLIPIDIKGSSDRIITEQVKLLKLYKKYDIVHFLDYAIPALYKGKKIATIHDMAMHTMKDKYTKGQVLIKTALLKNTIKNADKLICISEFTKKELLKYYPNVDESKIEVVYNGFEYNEIELTQQVKNADKLICISEFTKKELLKYYPNVDESKIEVVYNGFEYNEIELTQQVIDTILNKFNITKDYLLFVGTLSPHKNIKRIIEAFNKVRNEGYDYQLVICGKKGWLYEDIFKKVKDLKLESEVIFTDYVNDEELEVLYKNTKLFVFPSLYEGFGFPPIEAMARKAPVLTSREGAIPEVVGDAAIFCDAYDTKDIYNKIVKVINERYLLDKLIMKGNDRILQLSWENLGKKVCSIYRYIL